MGHDETKHGFTSNMGQFIFIDAPYVSDHMTRSRSASQFLIMGENCWKIGDLMARRPMKLIVRETGLLLKSKSIVSVGVRMIIDSVDDLSNVTKPVDRSMLTYCKRWLRSTHFSVVPRNSRNLIRRSFSND